MIGITALLTSLLFYFGIVRANYVSRDRFPIQGIDVSNHQGKIDWLQVKKQGVDFVYIKATEGGDFRDTQFLNNWQSAEQVGITRGAYHFFTFCKNGREQANNFIQTVPKSKGTLPPVIDLEFGGNCRLRSTKSGVVTELKQFMDIVEKTYHQKPIVYATQSAYDTFMSGNFPEHQIWIRDIWQQPTLKDRRNWTFWQYGNRGSIKGINGFVDLNVFDGNQKQFKRLLSN
ncbi:lysozyme [Merismopedia glauca CCAP 1448/3]|uniref:Lysozyme n=2 Tax=Merismopedia TaxID=53402 RepID=A0A2T1BZL5_9CYAN|nr:lysozyme [Merismopedia glauca CCAP 1448/3]